MLKLGSQESLAGIRPYLQQVSEQVVTQVLGRNKNQDLAILIEFSQDLQQAKEAVSLGPDFYELGDVLVHHRPAPNLDLHRLMQRLLCQCLHLNSSLA